MMKFSTFKRLKDAGDIDTLTAVGFGRFSKSEVSNIVDGVHKRSASFRAFSTPPGTKTIIVYPNRPIKGEPVSIAVGDSGGPYFARYRGVDYIVATVSTVTYTKTGDAAFATALNVDAPISFFENTILTEYTQSLGPHGFKYESPRKIKLDKSKLADLVVDENLCIDEYCIQEKPLLFGALALAPIVLYTILGLRLKEMK